MKKRRRQKKKIVILGAGFAGLYAGLKFKEAKLLLEDYEIIIIDENSRFLFTPLLVYALREKMNRSLIKKPLNEFFPNFKVIQSKIIKSDLEKKVLFSKERKYNFDYLITSTGSKTNYFDVKGAEKNAFGLKFFDDLEKLNKKIAKIEKTRKFQRIVIVGGGPSGVETALELQNRIIRKKNKKDFEIVIIDKNKRPLNNFSKYLSQKAKGALKKKAIRFMGGEEIKEAGADFIKFNSNKKLKCTLTVWTAGVKPELFKVKNNKNSASKRGFKQDKYLRLKGYSNIFVAGDAAFGINPKTKNPYPKLAQLAVKQGKAAAKNILRLIHKKKLKRFSFKQLGMIVPLGRNRAAAEIFGFKFNGFLASLIWKFVYCFKFPGIKRKVKLIKYLFF